MKKARLNTPLHQRERSSLLRKLNFILAFSVLMSTGALAGVGTPSTGEKMDQSSRAAEQQKQKKVTGKVVDSDNLPLPGVGIVVKNTTIGTSTDADGNFQLEIPENA